MKTLSESSHIDEVTCQRFIADTMNLHSDHLICWMTTSQCQLEEIVGKRLGGVTIEMGERDGQQITPYKRSHKLVLLSARQLTQYAIALAGDLHRYLVRHFRRRRARPRGIREYVQVGEWQALDERAGLLEVGVGLAGKTDH